MNNNEFYFQTINTLQNGDLLNVDINALSKLVNDKKELEKHFKGKDRDTLRVVKNALEQILKQEKNLENIVYYTDLPLKEKCESILKKNGYKYDEDPYCDSLLFTKTIKKLNNSDWIITIYVENFEYDDEFKDQLGIEIIDDKSDNNTFYNLKTKDLSSVIEKIEKGLKTKDIKNVFKNLTCYNKFIEEYDENYFIKKGNNVVLL